MGYFIDKLNVHQDHQRPLPLVGEHLVIRVDLATGETVSESPNFKIEEGSHSTKVTVRCNGSRVSVTGNPSRFNRLDNLFGLTTIDQCVGIFNHVLARYDLPPFTKCTQIQYRQGEEGSAIQLVTDGAIIDHIDWTRNLSVPPGTEEAFLRGLSSQSMGRGKTAFLYPNGQSCVWYTNSKWLHKKLYIKASDMLDRRIKNTRSATQEDKRYYNQLIEFCKKIGIVREEHSFKGPWLKRHNLHLYGRTDDSDFLPHLTDFDNIFQRLGAMTHVRYDTISDQLMTQNIVSSTQAANATQAYYFKWLHGQTIERNSQYYVHKARLLALGIDISVPYDITRVPPTVRANQLIEINSVAAPDWYRQPIAKPHVRLVA